MYVPNNKMGLINRRSVQNPHYWGLVQQIGPWENTPLDTKRLNAMQQVNRGGGVPDGGTAHAGHGQWNTLITPNKEAFPSPALPDPSPYSKISKIIPGPPQEALRPGRPSKYVYNQFQSGKLFHPDHITTYQDQHTYQELTQPLQDEHVAIPRHERSQVVGPFAHDIDENEEEYFDALSNTLAEERSETPHTPLLTESAQNPVHLAPEFKSTPFNQSTQTDAYETAAEKILLGAYHQSEEEVQQLITHINKINESHQKSIHEYGILITSLFDKFGIDRSTQNHIAQLIDQAKRNHTHIDELKQEIDHVLYQDFSRHYQFRTPAKFHHDIGTQTSQEGQKSKYPFSKSTVTRSVGKRPYTHDVAIQNAYGIRATPQRSVKQKVAYFDQL